MFTKRIMKTSIHSMQTKLPLIDVLVCISSAGDCKRPCVILVTMGVRHVYTKNQHHLSLITRQLQHLHIWIRKQMKTRSSLQHCFTASVRYIIVVERAYETIVFLKS